jgi:hypothetical protein
MRAVWWKFPAEHAHHPVELLWEHSEARERIDIDYIVVDSDIKGDPSFADYAGDWPGRRPRVADRTGRRRGGRTDHAVHGLRAPAR